MKKLIIFSAIALLISLVSCDKKEGTSSDDNSVTQNRYRVKRIEGNNKMWGEYQLLFYYSNNRIDSVMRCDLNSDIEKRDTAGYFTFKYDKFGSKSLSITDKVLKIDADSVERIKVLYPSSYQDTLRKRRAPVILYTNTYDWPTATETVKLNKSRDEYGVGKNFDYTYLNFHAQKNLVEYDKTGKPIIFRQFYDTYDQDPAENANYEKELYKYEIEYDGNLVIGIRYYIQNSHLDESWAMIDHNRMTYQDGVLMSVDGELYDMKRNGNSIVVKEKGETTTYTLDANGNAIRVDYADGSYAKIEYEKGSGNFSQMMYPYIDHLAGKSIIK